MLKRIILAMFMITPLTAISAEYYVSPQGNDEANGSIDHPYKTLHGAVTSIRNWRNSGGSGPVVAYLREGRHQLDSTLVLGVSDGDPSSSQREHSSEAGAGDALSRPYLTFAAYSGETPVVSAGIPVTGWKLLESAPAELPSVVAGKVWVADMPEGMDRFHTLFDDQGRLQRARDDEGFNYTSKGTATELHFPEGRLRNWSNLEDVEVIVRPNKPWVANLLTLKSVNTNTNVATTAQAATYTMSALAGLIAQPYPGQVWVENVLDHLDKPGEWVVNTQTRKIYLWPRDPARGGAPRGILAPSIEELIRVEGKIDYDGPTDVPVRGIAFRGLTFTHADRKAWWEYEQRRGWGMQHDWDMFDRPTAMVRFRGAEDCRVIQCRFVYGGGSGVRFDLHAQRNQVIDSEFANLGEAGVLLLGYGPGTKDVNKHNSIINNHIHHFSEITWHSPGVWAWQSGHNLIKNNHIHHGNYSLVLITGRVSPGRGLNSEGGRTIRHAEIPKGSYQGGEHYAGWSSREKYIHARHNLVEYNELTHAVQLLADGNVIYISGAGTGNIVRYNYIHNNDSITPLQNLRCDNDQHETTFHGNVLFRNYAKGSTILIKGKNYITNNIIYEASPNPFWHRIMLAWNAVTGAVVRKNIIVSHPDDNKKPYGVKKTNKAFVEDCDMDFNLYFHPTKPDWLKAHFTKMRNGGLHPGKEQASVFADPMFNDPEKGDFSFRPGSPALALGIEPLDVSKMGRLDDYSSHISDQ